MTHMWTICTRRGCLAVAMRDGVCTRHYTLPTNLSAAEVDAYVQDHCPNTWAWLMGGTA